MGYTHFLLLLSTAVLLVHKGESLKCWTCDNMYKSGCSDPFLGSAKVKDFTRDCESELGYSPKILPNGTTYTNIVDPGLEVVCLKLTETILGVKHVVRTCALGLPNITQESCVPIVLGKRMKEVEGIVETCDACSGDFCNGVAAVGTTALLVAPLLILFK